MSNKENISEWDFKYLAMAEYMGSMSKCASKQVGCIIVKDGTSIVSSGVNGTPSGYTNCNDIFHKDNTDEWHSTIATQDENDFLIVDGKKVYRIKDGDVTHKEFSLDYEIHAEVNAISKMAQSGVSSKGCTLYCNYSPCINCAKSIIAAGIDKVIFNKEYDDSNKVIKFFEVNNVEVIQLKI